MKRRMAFVAATILLIGTNLYAANGDLTVNGNLSVVGAINGTSKSIAMTGETSAQNISNITLASLSWTPIVTLDLGSVTAGDRFIIEANIMGGAGNVASMNQLNVGKNSGTATVQVNNSFAAANLGIYQTALSALNMSMSNVFKVTTSGTLVMQALIYTNGTGGYVNAGGGQLYAFFLKKQ